MLNTVISHNVACTLHNIRHAIFCRAACVSPAEQWVCLSDDLLNASDSLLAYDPQTCAKFEVHHPSPCISKGQSASRIQGCSGYAL